MIEWFKVSLKDQILRTLSLYQLTQMGKPLEIVRHHIQYRETERRFRSSYLEVMSLALFH